MRCSCIRTVFILSFGLLLPLFCLGQAAKTDSLKKVLASLPPEGRAYASDTMRVLVLCELGKAEQNDKVAEPIIKAAIALAKKIQWTEGEYICIYRLGKVYNRNGRYVEAVPLLYKSLYMFEMKKQTKKQAICLRDIGDAYLLLKKYDKAIELYQKSIALFKQLKEFKEYIDSLNNLALVYYSKRNYNFALKLFFECKKYESIVKGTLMEASYLSNIASCYREKKEFELSLKYFKLAEAIYGKNKDKYNNIYGVTLVEKAKVYREIGRIDESIKVANDAYLMNNKYNGNNQYVNELLVDLYEKSGDINNAYKHYKELVDSKNLALQQDKEKQVESLKFEYENKQQKIKIQLLDKDLENSAYKNRVFGLVVIVVAVFLILMFWNNRLLKMKNRQIDSQRQELSLLTLKLEEMNSNLEFKVQERTTELVKMNKELIQKNEDIKNALFNGQSIERKRVASELHDNLGGTLSGLIWQLEGISFENMNVSEQKIYESLILKMRDAYAEIRHISHNMLPGELEKSGLKKALEKLVNELNQNNKIQFILDVNMADKFNNRKIELELYSISMELLNNVIKHSSASIAGILINQSSTNLMLEVYDNGKGLNADRNTDGKGMRNIKDRVNSIGGKLVVESEPYVNTCIRVEVPLIK